MRSPFLRLQLGFVLEGRCVQRITRFGEVTDELIYGKLL